MYSTRDSFGFVVTALLCFTLLSLMTYIHTNIQQRNRDPPPSLARLAGKTLLTHSLIHSLIHFIHSLIHSLIHSVSTKKFKTKIHGNE